MNHCKKLLAFFLALALVFQMLPLSIFAEDTASAGRLGQESISKETNQAETKNETVQQSGIVVGEVTDLRGESQKHFRMEDGSFIAVDYGMPVHFTTDDGANWQEIDNTLMLSQAGSEEMQMMGTRDTASYVAKNGENATSFAANLRSGYLFSSKSGAYSVSMSLTDKASSGEVRSAEGNIAETDDAAAASAEAEVSVEQEASETTEASAEQETSETTEASVEKEDAETTEASVEKDATETTEASIEKEDTETAEASVEKEDIETAAKPAETEAACEAVDAEACVEQFDTNAAAEISNPGASEDSQSSASVRSQAVDAMKEKFSFFGKNEKTSSLSIAEQVEPKKLQSDVLYRNVYRDVDLRYELFGYNVKETIVVNRPRESYSFSFYLDMQGLKPVQMEDGSVELRNESDEVIYLIPAPYMTDANGAYSEEAFYKLSESKSGAWQLTVVADEKWINDKERAFPVEIDPTVIKKVAAAEITKRCYSSGASAENYIISTGRKNLVCGYHPDYKQVETYLKIPNDKLPTIPAGSEVVNASIALLQNDYRASNTGNVVLSMKPCLSAVTNPESLTWTQWTNIGFGPVLDYCVASSSTINKWHTWDITSEVKKWYADSSKNYGVAMTSNATSSNQRRIWFSYFNPYFVVTYRDMTGIEGYYTYQTAGAGRAGTAYISDYTGALTTVTPLVSYASTVNPFSMSVIYNSSYFKGEGPDYVSVPQNLGYGMKMGSGMKLSIMQKVEYIDLQYDVESSGTKRYIKYTDGDGTVHYFATDAEKQKNEASGSTTYYYDEDGLGLKITEYTTNYFRMEDDKGNKLFFVYGLLTIIQDANGNSINVYFSDENGNYTDPGYPNNTHKRIHHITQKNKGQTEITVASFAYDTIENQTNTLKSVTDAAGNVYTFNYTCYKLRSITRNGSSYAEFVHPYNSTTNRYVNPIVGLKDPVSGYSLTFNYTDSRISNYYETAGSTIGAGVDITRVLGEKTVYTDWGIDNKKATTADNISTIYLFDNAGRTVNAYSTDSTSAIIGASNAVYTSASGTDRQKNRTLTASGIGMAGVSMVRNGGFELSGSGLDWTFFKPDDSSCAVVVKDVTAAAANETVLVRTGNKALKTWVSSVNDGSTGAKKSAGLLKAGETYTFSVYVNTSIAQKCGSKGIYLRVDDTWGCYWLSEYLNYKTDSNIDGGWVKLSFSFTAAHDAYHSISICNEGFKGEVFYDDFRMETGNAPTNVNLLDNGALIDGAAGWKTEGNGTPAVSTNTLTSGSKSIQINGNPETAKYVHQTLTLNQPGTQTYVLSGWAKANAVPDNVNPEKGKEETDEAYRERLAKDTDKSFGLRAVLTYSDNTKEYFYAPFNADVTDWQFVSLAIVPRKQEKKVSTIQVYCVYEKNANTAYFDNLSLVKEVAQTMKYDEDGNLVSVQSSGNEEEKTTYENGNLIQVKTGGSGTFNYSYDDKHNLTDAANSVVKEHYDYNAAGNLTETNLTKAEGNATAAETIYSNRTYTNKENLVDTVTDANGSEVKYTYGGASSKMFGLPTKTKDPKGTTVFTNYDDLGRAVLSYITSVVSLSSTYDSKGRLASQERGGYYNGTASTQKYNFTYNDFGETTKITLGNNNQYTLVQNTYAGRGGLLTQSKYGNGATVSYTYDNYGRTIQTDTSSGDRYTYTYTGDSQLYAMKDVSGKLLYQYNYDTLGRLIGSTMKSNGVLSLQTSHRYDENNRMVNQSWSMGGKTYQESYTYDNSNGRLTKKTVTLPNNTASDIVLGYDSLSRLESVNTPMYQVEYQYAAAQNRANGGATTRVSQMCVEPKQSGKYVFDRLCYEYQYDELGNITQIRELLPDDSLYEKTDYTYDKQSQLTKAQTNGGLLWTYDYDTYGNLRQRYYSMAGVSDATYAYTYGDTAWVDRLTGLSVIKNGKTTTGSYSYDGAGNPTTYFNPGDLATWTMTWKNARELSKATKSGTTLEFDYDVNGLRTYKKVGSVQHDYLYASGQLLRETYTQNGTTYTLDFLYDASGRPYMLNLTKSGSQSGTAVYYYLLNLQGDVVGMTDTTGKLVAEYSYDPFGNSIYTQNSEIGRTNPLRYRGYYYDSETGFYYLQSRYYDPVLGRFINADGFASTGQGFLGYNMFAYCNNNPVDAADPAGLACYNVCDDPDLMLGSNRKTERHDFVNLQGSGKKPMLMSDSGGEYMPPPQWPLLSYDCAQFCFEHGYSYDEGIEIYYGSCRTVCMADIGHGASFKNNSVSYEAHATASHTHLDVTDNYSIEADFLSAKGEAYISTEGVGLNGSLTVVGVSNSYGPVSIGMNLGIGLNVELGKKMHFGIGLFDIAIDWTKVF